MLDKEKTYYFLGIKGTGMSALALVMHDLGFKVLGSDITKHTFTEDPLRAKGIEILPFDPANIKEDYVVVKGNAFKEDNPEVRQSLEMGVVVQSYPDTLSELLANYISIGVAGAHGKTSTTGIMAHCLGGLEKTNFLIGDGTGVGQQDAKFFVYEADEYRRHFLAYNPDYLVMTNIEFDHPDYFKDLDDVVAAFQTAANQVKKGLLVYGDDENLQKITAPVPKLTYGFGENDDYRAVNIEKGTHGAAFDVLYHGENLGNFMIHLFGDHNIFNSLAVIAVAHQENLSLDLIADELLTYHGTKRRFAETTYGTTVVIDDYAHHPTEIKATLLAARQKYPTKKLVAVFQPHTFSRTLEFQDQFAEILQTADQVYLTPIFGSAREAQGSISSEDLAAKISPTTEVITKDTVQDMLQDEAAVYVFMGAGDIQKYETEFEKLLK